MMMQTTDADLQQLGNETMMMPTTDLFKSQREVITVENGNYDARIVSPQQPPSLQHGELTVSSAQNTDRKTHLRKCYLVSQNNFERYIKNGNPTVRLVYPQQLPALQKSVPTVPCSETAEKKREVTTISLFPRDRTEHREDSENKADPPQQVPSLLKIQSTMPSAETIDKDMDDKENIPDYSSDSEDEPDNPPLFTPSLFKIETPLPRAKKTPDKKPTEIPKTTLDYHRESEEVFPWQKNETTMSSVATSENETPAKKHYVVPLEVYEYCQKDVTFARCYYENITSMGYIPCVPKPERKYPNSYYQDLYRLIDTYGGRRFPTTTEKVIMKNNKRLRRYMGHDKEDESVSEKKLAAMGLTRVYKRKNKAGKTAANTQQYCDWMLGVPGKPRPLPRKWTEAELEAMREQQRIIQEVLNKSDNNSENLFEEQRKYELDAYFQE